MNSFTLASWNIAAGRTSKSDAQFDYNEEDLSYFIEMLRSTNADILCLQEVHANKEHNQAKKIAEQLGMSHYFSAAHPSHIDPDFMMGNALFANTSLKNTTTTFFPNPWFDMYFKSGKKALEHPKNVQVVGFNDVFIGNLHLLPLRLFSLDYNDNGLGNELARKIEETLLTLPDNIILCGDFNFAHPEEIYTTFMKEKNLQKVEWENHDSDHIFYPKSMTILDKRVIKTRSDHDLYVVTFGV